MTRTLSFEIINCQFCMLSALDKWTNPTCLSKIPKRYPLVRPNEGFDRPEFCYTTFVLSTVLDTIKSYYEQNRSNFGWVATVCSSMDFFCMENIKNVPKIFILYFKIYGSCRNKNVYNFLSKSFLISIFLIELVCDCELFASICVKVISFTDI